MVDSTRIYGCIRGGIVKSGQYKENHMLHVENSNERQKVSISYMVLKHAVLVLMHFFTEKYLYFVFKFVLKLFEQCDEKFKANCSLFVPDLFGLPISLLLSENSNRGLVSSASASVLVGLELPRPRVNW